MVNVVAKQLNLKKLHGPRYEVEMLGLVGVKKKRERN